jgi:transglutaminase-like putative cysteine protease
MPTATASTTAAAGEFGVRRYFEVSLYLLIATGFFTLAGTGKLDLVSLACISITLIIRGWLLLRGRNILLPEQWTNYATLAYVIFYLADLFFLSANFVYATVHLVLFSMAVKLFSVQRSRDHVYLIVLSFLMVLAAAVLTVDSTFLFLFCLFMVLAAAAFISMEMQRSAAKAARMAPLGPQHRIGRALSLTASLLVLGIVATGFALFFLLPRQTGGYLSSLAQNEELLTGFSNDVTLGRIGEIKQSRSVVMHIQINGDSAGAYSDLKWRGVGLSIFDGRRWSRPLEPCAFVRMRFAAFTLADAHSPCSVELPLARGSRPLRYRVLMEPIGTNVFFLAPTGVLLTGNYRLITGDFNGSFSSPYQPVGSYEALSNLAEPTPAQLRNVSNQLPPEIGLRYLQLPALDPRITGLAKRITAGKTNNYDRAAAIEEYLKTKYIYTLQLPASIPADPIADFLFNRRRGHCEYFASAMAVMLRSLGIPSRIVNGFRGAEFNDINSTYLVRASSAHTWVEVYFPGYGWITFDPTPPDPASGQTKLSRVSLYLDALGEFWREWVVNYDFGHQLTLHNEIFARSNDTFVSLKLWLRRKYLALLSGARRAPSKQDLRNRALVGCAVMAFLLFTMFLPRMLRSWRKRQLAAHPAAAPRTAAAIWYERMTVQLARRGFPKKPSQTPKEFVHSISSDELRAPVAEFTGHYERARFDEDPTEAEKLPDLYEELISKR